MKRLATIGILCAALASCASSPKYANAAARECGQSRYLEIERDGRPDFIAVIPCNGTWRWYDPYQGSFNSTVPTSRPPPNQVWWNEQLGNVSGKTKWHDVTEGPSIWLPNGCVVDAVASQRTHGGIIVETQTHAINVYY